MTRKKGQLTTSDYLTIEDFKRLLDGLHQDKLFAWEFYCRVSFYTAFRASDVRSLTWQDLLNRKELMRVEQKTAKGRRIVLEEGFANEVSHFYQLLGSPAVDEPFFCNHRTGKVYGLEYINLKFKQFRVRYQLKVGAFSTHSIRKTFARYYFDSENCTTEALMTLKDLLNHADVSTTARYIGLKQDMINRAYSSAFSAISLNEY